jgi:hypothetical protein
VKAMTLKEILSDWERITTAAKLKKVILQAANILNDSGDTVTAERFIKNTEKMPASMEKESINYVLYAICVEVGTIK